MNNTSLLIIFLLTVLIILFINDNEKNKKNNKENFKLLFYESSPSTRNMSYDLRCEPPIRKKNYPFYGSTITPLVRPKCLQ